MKKLRKQHDPAEKLWEKSDAEEKIKIRQFWLSLSENERKSLVKIEKEAVLRKMKEQQKNHCNCTICGRKKGVIEEELEILYDAYYRELEHCTHSRDQISALTHIADPPYQSPSSIYEFGNNLTARGGILTLADDFLKNDGRRFLDLMEQLAERKLRQFEIDEEDYDEYEDDYHEDGEWDDGYDDEDYDDDDEEEEEQGQDEFEKMSENERIEEGRRMFQIFAAKMFEQRVLNAYREKVANEKQLMLLAELEEEERAQEEREVKKVQKKAAKKLQKQQKELERIEKDKLRLAEEEKNRIEKEKALEEERFDLCLRFKRLIKVNERKLKEQERLKRDEIVRLKKEEESIKEEEKIKAELKKKDLEIKKVKKVKEQKENTKKDKLNIVHSKATELQKSPNLDSPYLGSKLQICINQQSPKILETIPPTFNKIEMTLPIKTQTLTKPLNLDSKPQPAPHLTNTPKAQLPIAQDSNLSPHPTPIILAKSQTLPLPINKQSPLIQHHPPILTDPSTWNNSPPIHHLPFPNVYSNMMPNHGSNSNSNMMSINSVNPNIMNPAGIPNHPNMMPPMHPLNFGPLSDRQFIATDPHTLGIYPQPPLMPYPMYNNVPYYNNMYSRTEVPELENGYINALDLGLNSNQHRPAPISRPKPKDIPPGLIRPINEKDMKTIWAQDSIVSDAMNAGLKGLDISSKEEDSIQGQSGYVSTIWESKIFL